MIIQLFFFFSYSYKYLGTMVWLIVNTLLVGMINFKIFNFIPNLKKIIKSVLEGERLIKNVYEALRNGKNWNETLLIITYDEHVKINIFFIQSIINNYYFKKI